MNVSGLIGPLINAIAIVAGGLLGLAVGRRVPLRIREAMTGVFGLSGIVIGIFLVPKAPSLTPVILALVIGTLAGELLNIDALLKALAGRIQLLAQRMAGGLDASAKEQFSQTFSNVLLLFVTGPIALVGSMASGLRNDYSLLAAKSVLDAFASLTFAPILGIAAAGMAVPVLLVQGAYALGAGLLSSVLGDRDIAYLGAVGGVILCATGLRVLQIKDLRSTNMLPALLLVPFAVRVLAALGL